MLSEYQRTFFLNSKEKITWTKVSQIFWPQNFFPFLTYLGSQITYVYVIVLYLLIFTVLGIKTNF